MSVEDNTLAGEPSSSARKYPIILHSSLAQGQLFRLLQESESLRPRVSTAILARSCILPTQSVALLVLSIDDIYIVRKPIALASAETAETACTDTQPPQLNTPIVKSVQEFIQLHRNCYVLLCGQDQTPQRLAALDVFQRRFFNAGISVVLVRDSAQCVQFITGIAKVGKAEIRTKLHQHHIRTMQQCGVMHLEKVISLLQLAGIRSHDAIVLYDSFGSLANLAHASLEQLGQCCVPRTVAEAVYDFLRNDCVPI